MEERSEFAITDGQASARLGSGGLVRIGRAEVCELRLEAAGIAPIHARAFVRSGALWIEDLGSDTGVFVGGARIAEPTRITPGDQVLVGSCRILVQPVLGGSILGDPQSTGIAGPAREILLDRLREAIAARRSEEITEVAAMLCETLLNAGENADPRVVRDATEQFLLLADATRDGRWLDVVLRLRRVTDMPLDAAGLASLSERYARFAPGSPAERAGYVEWAQGHVRTEEQRVALGKLVG